jgi:hypothetical protein
LILLKASLTSFPPPQFWSPCVAFFQFPYPVFDSPIKILSNTFATINEDAAAEVSLFIHVGASILTESMLGHVQEGRLDDRRVSRLESTLPFINLDPQSEGR